MKSTRARAARPHTITPEQDAHLCAVYRAKYPKEIADYRKKFGEEPSLGTLIAAEARAECNNHTEEERAENFAYAMSIINGTACKPHAHA